MPADDSLLGQGTVDAREEERIFRCPDCWSPLELGHDCLAGEQTSFCTRSPGCAALHGDHLAGCPVEEALRQELGF